MMVLKHIEESAIIALKLGITYLKTHFVWVNSSAAALNKFQP